ncbi:hypothetical protein EMIT047CA2_200005 [Pseudomonas soli]
MGNLKPCGDVIDEGFSHFPEVMSSPNYRTILIFHPAPQSELIDAVHQKRGLLKRFLTRNAGINTEQR